MTPPTATYRLQFRNGFDFEAAIPVARYLTRLGISHLYASPIFQAAPGSTHGYDVTDHQRLDDSLGGIDGFRRLSDECRSLGLGIILDIVPNHMAASPHNPWWRDVLRHGRLSRYAGYFDIDWSRERLLLPWLGQSFDEVLAAGELSLGHDDEGLTLRYFDQAVPLGSASTGELLAGFQPIDPADFPGWLADDANRQSLERHLATLSQDTPLIGRLHAAQAYRLSHWRRGRDRLGYRRFFEISDLVGVRVEDDSVFDDVHRLIFELVGAGHVDGLRIDHVDGLTDPRKYLSDLRAKLPRDIPVWIEKILAADEALPADWATLGATGYEFAADVGRLLTHGEGIEALDAAYRSYSGVDKPYEAMVGEAKIEIFTRNLEAELNALTAFAKQALGGRIDEDQLRRGIVALMSALPVYRTYFTAEDTFDADLRILDRAVERAKRKAVDAIVIDMLAGLLTSSEARTGAFTARFQQTSAALEAKAVEDTVFYRFNRLLSANEVGSAPSMPSMAPAQFHQQMAERVASHPFALNGTATHDTKRGEDARMRIAAISEMPDAWLDGVARFDAILGSQATKACDPNMRWLFYQALLGAWALPADAGLTERMTEFLLKAARENKQHTSWVDQDEGYEAGLAAFAEKALFDHDFKSAFAAEAAPFIRIGERKSLVQLGLKLFTPGIPDIYQGTEFADLSLVDPDNRRPVDFARRLGCLESGFSGVTEFDRRKMELLCFGLKARRLWPELFTAGYRAKADSANVIAFSREHEGRALHLAAALSGTATPVIETHGRVLAAYPPDGEHIGISIAVLDGVRTEV